MATARISTKTQQVEIDKFLGLNESVGNTEVKLGEFSLMENFRITKNMKLKKRPGHHTFIDFGSGNVQGIWEGTISTFATKNIMLALWNGSIYEYDMDISTTTTAIADLITEGTVTIIGAITDVKTSIFWFDGKILFINGTDFKEYNGSTYKDVTVKVPTIALSAPPTGGGTLFEEINLLTGSKKMTFIGDGATAVYQLPESGIGTDTVFITVDGVSYTEGVDFTVNRGLGQVTFVVTPPSLSTVEIEWVKVVSSHKAYVTGNKYAINFGYQNNTNVFIYGHEEDKNVFRFSAIGEAGYFPVNSYVNVGSDQFAITGLVPQYQTLVVFKERSSHLVQPTNNPNFEENAGLNPYNYGYTGLNGHIGNKAPNMAILVKDNPISLHGYSLREWESTTGVSNEIEPTIISDRIKLSLQTLNLSTAVTFNFEFQKELWINIDDVVYIWNYGNNTYYKYTNIQATEFIDKDDLIYYASNGTVEILSNSFKADGTVLGDSIPCVGKLAFSDFDMLNLEKNMRDEWIAIEPASRTSCIVKFVTDRKNEEKSKELPVSYVLMDFNNIDFNNFSFLTNVNPQPKRLRGKIKKFTYLQTVFENDTNNESLNILKLLLMFRAHRNSG